MTQPDWLQWQNIVTQWWRAAGMGPPQAPGFTPDFARMQDYMRFGRLISEVLKNLPQSPKPDEFTRLWQSYANQVQALFGDEMARGLHNSSKGSDMVSALLEPLRNYLSFRAIGYTREWQERIQHVERTSAQWVEAQSKLQSLHSRILTDSWEQFGRRIQQLDAEDLPGLRELYDRWIDCAEQNYQRCVMQGDYSELYGNTLNKMVAMKGAVRSLLDDVFALFNLPNRRELDGIHARLRSISAPVQDAELPGVRGEIEQLREQVDILTGQLDELHARLERAAASSGRESMSVPAVKRTRARPKRGSKKAPRTGRSAPGKRAKREEFDIGNL